MAVHDPDPVCKLPDDDEQLSLELDPPSATAPPSGPNAKGDRRRARWLLTEINLVIGAAYTTYPEKDHGEILAICGKALEERLLHALREHRQAIVSDFRTRLYEKDV